MGKAPTVVLWTRVPIEVAAKLTEVATAQGKTTSDFLREALTIAIGTVDAIERKVRRAAPKRTKRAKGGAK